MSIRPYLLLRDSDLREIEAQIDPLVERWAAQWLAIAEPVHVEDLRAYDHRAAMNAGLRSAREGCCLTSGGSPLAAAGVSSGRYFVDSLLGVGGADGNERLTPIEVDLERAALEALLLGLVDGEQVEWMEAQEVGPAIGHGIRPGASGLIFSVRVGQCRIETVFSPAGLARLWSGRSSVLAPSRGALSPVREGLVDLERPTVQLPARLGETEMTVRDFVSLEVGDVIVMDMSCDAPIEIRLGAGPGALRGYLGSDSGISALQMIRTEARA